MSHIFHIKKNNKPTALVKFSPFKAANKIGFCVLSMGMLLLVVNWRSLDLHMRLACKAERSAEAPQQLQELTSWYFLHTGYNTAVQNTSYHPRANSPVPSGPYLIHKSTHCRVSQGIFVSPSCSSWLVHLKTGDKAVMAKQGQILSTLVCHQNELIFLQSYVHAQQSKHILTGFSNCQ